MAEIGPRVIRDHMPDQHRTFFASLPFLLIGGRDGHGQPWASVLSGQPGFLQSPNPRTLRIAALPPPGSPLDGTLQVGAALGLLGIEAHTRRRNRMNGTVRATWQDGCEIGVTQSFGNCPKYIRRRVASYLGGGTPRRAEELPILDDAARALVARADTLFIASAHRSGVDVSHRGGEPGFVELLDRDTLLLPDYVGNFFFNTLGNLVLEPRAGLLFIDHANGDLLHVAAHAEILWDGPAVRARAGAQRVLRLAIRQASRLPGGLPMSWSMVD